MTRCSRYGQRSLRPCQAPAWYEVDMPSPTLGTATGAFACGRHLSQVVDDAWAELARLIERGMIDADSGEAVHVRRTPDAPRLPSLFERLDESVRPSP